MKRLNFYVDGFNLYFGMVKAGYIDCKWLDIHKFANLLKHPSHTLNSVKYFTSRVNNNPAKQRRQSEYLDALATTDVKIIEGQFRTEWLNCHKCEEGWWDSKEKMTDVNIATHLMIDAFEDSFDVAILVSGDSDLVPPVKNILRLFPNKEIRIAFPPERQSNELKNVSSGSFKIGHGKLSACQFPLSLVNKYGITLNKPTQWL